jgi:hypothetical protein
MKNFIDRIECVVEPSLYFHREGESVQIRIRCVTDDKEYRVSRVEPKDFLRSHFDVVFDYMREELKHGLLEEVKKEDVE